MKTEAFRVYSEEFEELYRANYPMLCAYAYRLLGDPEEARDIVLEFFADFFELGQKQELRVFPKNYLFRSVANRVKNHVRKQGVRQCYSRESLVGMPAGTDCVSESYEAEELGEILEEVVAKLPDRCREVFEMSRYAGMKNREVADALGISVKTVENQLCKALACIRRDLESHGIDVLRVAVLISFLNA